MNIQSLRKTNVVLIFVFTILFFHNSAEACSETPQGKYLIEEDSMGRLIVLWIDSNEGGSLKISIEGRDEQTISLPGQHCLYPHLGVTEEGHLIVVWAGQIPDKELYTLYGAKLPFKGKWTVPEIITDQDEMVVLASCKMLAKDSNKINIFWESVDFRPSEADPEILSHKKYLRCLKGTFKSWGAPKNIALLRQST